MGDGGVRRSPSSLSWEVAHCALAARDVLTISALVRAYHPAIPNRSPNLPPARPAGTNVRKGRQPANRRSTRTPAAPPRRRPGTFVTTHGADRKHPRGCPSRWSRLNARDQSRLRQLFDHLDQVPAAVPVASGVSRRSQLLARRHRHRTRRHDLRRHQSRRRLRRYGGHRCHRPERAPIALVAPNQRSMNLGRPGPTLTTTCREPRLLNVEFVLHHPVRRPASGCGFQGRHHAGNGRRHRRRLCSRHRPSLGRSDTDGYRSASTDARTAAAEVAGSFAAVSNTSPSASAHRRSSWTVSLPSGVDNSPR